MSGAFSESFKKARINPTKRGEEAGAGRAREEGKKGVGCGVTLADKHDTGV